MSISTYNVPLLVPFPEKIKARVEAREKGNRDFVRARMRCPFIFGDDDGR